MAIITETFVGDGSTKEFTVSSTMLSKSHVRVDLYYGSTGSKDDVDATDHLIPESQWDVLSATVLFDTAPVNDYEVRITVSSDGTGLDTAPSVYATVVTNINEILALSAIIAEILSLEAIDAEIVSLESIKTELLALHTDLASIITTANNITDVNSFAKTYIINDVEPTIITHDYLTEGDIWYDTTNNRIMLYNGASFDIGYIGTIVSDELTFTNKTIDSITNFVGANHIHYPIRNKSGATIPKGTVITGDTTQSGTDYIEVITVTDPQTEVALGITHTELLNNDAGLAINTGVCIDMVDTSAWTEGTILYPNTSGGFTSTKPTTGVYQACAVVTRSHASQGTMIVEFSEPKRAEWDDRYYTEAESDAKYEPKIAVTTLTSGTTINLDFSLGTDFEVTLDHNATFTITNLASAVDDTLVLRIKQGTTGGTGAFHTDFGFVTVPTLSSTTGVTDIVVVDISGIDNTAHSEFLAGE